MPSGTRRRVHNGKHYFYLSRQDKDPGPDLAYTFKINAVLHSVHFKYFAHFLLVETSLVKSKIA